jgi:hypothetical protein
VNVELVLYPQTIAHEPPGGCIQNWYWGDAQPAAVAVNVTCVPDGCGESGLAVRVADAHVGPVTR